MKKQETNFSEIILKSFGDGFNERNFVADVNFALAAMVKLSSCSTMYLEKDAIIKGSNKMELENIGTETEDGSVWDDIFEELHNAGLIGKEVHNSHLTVCAIDEIEKKYGKIIF